MGRLLRKTRCAASEQTLADLITNATYDELEDAVSDALGTYVRVYDDPWEPAREAVDDEYIRDLHVSNAEDVAERVRGWLSRGEVIEFDTSTGDLEAVYADAAEAVQKMNEPWVADLAAQHEDVNAFCKAFNDEVYDTWLVTRTCFPAVKAALMDQAADVAAADGDWDDYARDWMDENGIDEDAELLLYVEERGEYVNCREDNLVQAVLKLCDTAEQRDALRDALSA